jgi:protein TonB
MNFALSQHRTDRHPVGLLIVVGLHVVLAGALLSARLVKGPAEPAWIDIKPMDQPKPIERKPVDLPKVRDPVIHPPLVTPPTEIPVDKTVDTLVAPPVTDDKPVVVAAVGLPNDNVVHEQPVRVTARPAVINAGAAQCHPEYPAAALRAGATGTTLIRFSVDATGRISGSRILQASGSSRENRLMDKAAADALAQCPVQVGTDELGRPVGTTTDVRYDWKLN